MPHIHTEPGQADFTVSVYVVCGNKVLYRFHDKVHKWLVPGGHIELNEVPEQAALREVFEETGLEISLYNPEGVKLVEKNEDPESVGSVDNRTLLVPVFMDVHPMLGQKELHGGHHRHIDCVFLATAHTTDIHEQAGEKSGGILWLTREELEQHSEIGALQKKYGH